MSPATTTNTPMTTNGVTTLRRHHPPPSQRPTTPADCWSADETLTLIDAWGSLHLSLNRGSLRQQNWAQVAAAVNSVAETNDARRRTDVQCKNRIDTLKKKYKTEKSKVLTVGGYVSPWEYFSRLDFLIAGDTSLMMPTPTPVLEVVTPVITSFPVRRRSALPRRPARWLTEDGDEEEEEGGASVSSGCGGGGDGRKEEEVERSKDGHRDGCRELAEAIRRFGEVYERVETTKHEKLIELEKHRMEFTKELEFQRMKLFVDTQLQLFSKIKRSKLNPPDLDSFL